MAVTVYVACKMTGRDKAEMLKRALYVKSLFACFDIDVISPVIEEGVTDEKTPLVQTSKEQLQNYWKRDKAIITYKAHVIFFDQAEQKSLGVERELGFARYCLWKPCVVLLPDSGFGAGPTIADFEDDYVVHGLIDAALHINQLWGSLYKRFKWRFLMLLNTLPKWLYRQIRQWR